MIDQDNKALDDSNDVALMEFLEGWLPVLQGSNQQYFVPTQLSEPRLDLKASNNLAEAKRV